MPYSIDNPPEKIKDMPKHAQEIFISAFNNALKQYEGDEERANKVAYNAVKAKYKQDKDGNWVAKEAVHPHGEHICVCPECEKEITVAEGVKCNTQKCPECGEPMVAQTAGERRGSMKEAMSADDKRNLLQSALETKFPSPERAMMGTWIVDVFETEIVYRHDGVDYKAPYVVDPDGTVTLGEPMKVKRQTVYTPIESLQRVYSEIIQETGKRNAQLDAGRIKKILALCQELLSTEGEDEKKVNEATREAISVLEFLRAQEAMKPEDGNLYPAAAFAYVPDRTESSGWKLRLWEDPEKKTTKAQLGRVAASLSPGGLSGHKVTIPKEALASVKRKIRAAYRLLEVEEDDIPKWVRESESRSLLMNFTSLEEATLDTKGIARIVVIAPGFGNPVDNHYYPAETLARDYPIFEGVKMYADHQTEEEEKERPEGSIRQWVASLKNVTFEEGVGIVGDAVIIEPWLQQKLAALRDKKLLSEMGISIRAAGIGTKDKIDGKETNVVDRITQVRSVDFVTEAGAGGGVLLYETEREFDIDIISLGVLRERRPDLVKSIETEVKTTIMKEVKQTMELQEQVTELEGQVATVTGERDVALAKITEAEKAQRIAEAKSAIAEAIGKSELPEAARKRLVEKFKESESADGITEAIQVETEYVNALKEASKPKKLGGSQPNPEEDKKAPRESFKTMHPEWTEEQLDTAVAGR